MAEIQERWSAGEKTLSYTVEMEGAVVEVGPHQHPFRYQVDAVGITTTWTIGLEEEGRTFVTLRCRRLMWRKSLPPLVDHRGGDALPGGPSGGPVLAGGHHHQGVPQGRGLSPNLT